MEGKQIAGMAVAAAAAMLFAAGCASTGGSGMMAKVHCEGANACKGKSECKTSNSGCNGQNACKGQGWVTMSKDECAAAGGKS